MNGHQNQHNDKFKVAFFKFLRIVICNVMGKCAFTVIDMTLWDFVKSQILSIICKNTLYVPMEIYAVNGHSLTPKFSEKKEIKFP